MGQISQPADRRQPWNASDEALLVAVLTLAGAALRLWMLGRQSFWQDELIWASWIAQRTPWDVVREVSFPHSPFFALLLWPFSWLTSSDAGARIFAAIFGALNIPALYLLGKRLYDRRTGFGAAAILAVCPIHMHYSRQVEPYTLQVLLVTLFALALWTAWHGACWKPWLWVALTAAAAVYAHIFAAFAIAMMMAALGLDWLFRDRRWRRLGPPAAAMAGALGLYLPWVLWHAKTCPLGGDFFSLQYPSLFALDSLALFAASLWHDTAQFDSVLPPWTGVAAVVFVIIALRAGRRNPPALLFLGLWFLSIGWAIGTIWYRGYYLTGRYMLAAVPALALLGGAGLRSLAAAGMPRQIRPLLRQALGVLCAASLLVWNLGLVGEVLVAPAFQDFRGILPLVERNLAPQDRLFANVWHSEYACSRYAPGLASRLESCTEEPGWNELMRALSKGKRVWIVCEWGFQPEQYQWVADQGFSNIVVHTANSTASLWIVWPDRQLPRSQVVTLARRVLLDALQHGAGSAAAQYMQLGKLADDAPKSRVPAAWHWAEAARRLSWNRWLAPYSRLSHEWMAACYEGSGRYFEAAQEYAGLEAMLWRSSSDLAKRRQACLARQTAAYESLGLMPRHGPGEKAARPTRVGSTRPNEKPDSGS